MEEKAKHEKARPLGNGNKCPPLSRREREEDNELQTALRYGLAFAVALSTRKSVPPCGDCTCSNTPLFSAAAVNLSRSAWTDSTGCLSTRVITVLLAVMLAA